MQQTFVHLLVCIKSLY